MLSFCVGRLLGAVAVATVGVAGDNGAQGFGCPGAGPSAAPPTSVHRLRPGDVKVVAAFGDSLTAANGAGGHNYADVFKQYRGMSFSIGGDGNLDEMITIPNILETFNHVVGASHAVCPATNEKFARLNVAVPGSKIWDLPDQALELIRRVKTDPAIDFAKDWKLVSLLIGTNDLCQECQGSKEGHNTANPFAAPTTGLPWWKHTTTTTGPPTSSHASTRKPSRIQPLRDVLGLLRDELPRTFVSLIGTNRVDQLARTHNQSVMCKYLHKFMCPCLLQPDFAAEEAKLQAEVQEAASEPSLHNKEDFTVVVQPLLEHYVFPKTADGTVDLNFLAPDCFHWSQMGHARMAASLWNDMLAPTGQKPTAVTTHKAKLSCPDVLCPYLRTPANSIRCF